MSAWLTGFLLALAPLLWLVLLLALGRYPGETTIERARRAIALLLRPARSTVSPDPEPDRSPVPARGGTLIATSLAGRAPPSFPVVQELIRSESGGHAAGKEYMNLNKRTVARLANPVGTEEAPAEEHRRPALRRVGLLLSFLAALLIAPAFPGMAGAHVEMTPSKAPAGQPVNLSFEIPHGCDGAATTSLVVQIPSGAVDTTATAVKGWRARTAPDTLTWTGGPLPDHETASFPFRTTVYGKKGETVPFKVIQKCQGGAQTAWIQTQSAGVEPEHPAPAVTLTSTAAEPAAEAQAGDDQVAGEDSAATGEPTATAADSDDSSDGDGGDTKTVLLLIVAGLAIGTVAGIVVRSRRNS